MNKDLNLLFDLRQRVESLSLLFLTIFWNCTRETNFFKFIINQEQEVQRRCFRQMSCDNKTRLTSRAALWRGANVINVVLDTLEQ